MISIIQNKKLQTSEVQVWENVLKWGLAQNPELPSDPVNFSNGNFNTLKNTLQQCIPFIRFYNLTSKEFTNKVFPYRKILPEELNEDLLKTFLSLSDSDSKPSEKSKPRTTKDITYQRVELISKWIDRLEISDEMKNSYEFKLLFCGSRDGFTPKKFHEICDGQSRTVTIVKVKDDSSEILGGYNPISWTNSDGSYSTPKGSELGGYNPTVRKEHYKG